jgi:hypothetical protein
MILILDPRTDDLTSQRAFDIWDEGGEQHPVLGRLENMAAGEQTEASLRRISLMRSKPLFSGVSSSKDRQGPGRQAA